MERYLKRFLTVGIAVLALVAMLGLQAKVVWAVQEVLLIQDTTPYLVFGNPVPTEATSLNKTINIIQSIALNTMTADDLNQYKIIVLAEGQPGSYYANLAVPNNQANIASAVNKGSILIAHLADEAGGIDGYTLPGGVTVINNGLASQTNNITPTLTACVLNGLTEAALETWGVPTAYGVFTNLGGVAASVVVQAINAVPTYTGPCYITYSWGSGYVEATTMGVENAYNAGANAAFRLLENELDCAQQRIPAPADISAALARIQLDLVAIEAKLDNPDDHHCPACNCPECPLPTPEPLPWWKPGSEAKPPWSSILPLSRR